MGSLIFSVKQQLPFIIFFLSCLSSLAQDEIRPLDCLEPSASATSFISQATYIPLETKSECLLIYLSNAYIDQDGLILKDRNTWLFANDGKFIRKFGRTGKGPGEYSMIKDVFYDRNHRTVEILTTSNKILTYNVEGDLLKESKGTESFSFGKTTEGNYLFFNHYTPLGLYSKARSPILLGLTNSRGRLVHDFSNDFNHYGYFVAPSNSGNISSVNDTLLFVPSRNTSVYQLNGNNLELRYDINFGKRELPAKYQNTRHFDRRTFNSIRKHYVTQMWEFFESDDLISFTYFLSGKPYYYFLSKKRRKEISFEKSQLKNDFNGLPMGVLIGISGNSVITYLGADKLIDTLDSLMESSSETAKNEFAQKNPSLMNIYNNATYNDNPIIILYEIDFKNDYSQK
jgi:hypothetical protein